MVSPIADDTTEIQALRERLAEAEEILRAIRAGDIDALIVSSPQAPGVYTLKSADSPYRLLVEQMREGALTVSGDGVILYCNAAFAQIVGLASERLRGTLLTDLIVDVAYRQPTDLFPASGTSGRDIRLRTSSGSIRDVFVSSAPLTIDGERVHCVVITDLTRQQLRLRHEAIVRSSADAIYSLTFRGTIATWNRAAEELYGYTAQEAIGRNVDMLVPLQDRNAPEMIASGLGQEKLVQHEVVRLSKSGTPIDVSLSVAPLQSADGVVEGVSVIARNITERKRADDHLRFMLRETSHRSKNLLAVIQAIAGQTAKAASTIEQFETRFMQRLHAIALCHDLLVDENWTRANLADLVRQQLRPFADPGLRLTLDGPPVFVTPDAAQHLGLALHELATNALKYGALSMPTGNVTVAWALNGAGDGQQLHFSWRERNGPPVTAPTHSGFGSVVIRSLVAQSLNGKVHTDFASEGFWWALDAPSYGIVVRDAAGTN